VPQLSYFHARYSEFDAQVHIETGEILQGALPRRAARLVEEWRQLHQLELAHAWITARVTGDFAKIEALP
jgi:Domain of unknown function (DUF4160)